MPDLLDLGWLQAKGLQPGEETLPEVAETEHPEIVLDPAIINHLSEMGFPPEACKRAAYFSENGGIEAAAAWLMHHIADDNIADPFVPPGLMSKKGEFFSFNSKIYHYSASTLQASDSIQKFKILTVVA